MTFPSGLNGLAPVLFTTASLAGELGAELLGPGDIQIRGVETLERAGPEHLSFVRDQRNLNRWTEARCGAALASRSIVPAGLPDGALRSRALLVVPDADQALIVVLAKLAPERRAPAGSHPSASIDPSARLGADVSVGPGCVIGAGTVVDAGSVLHAGVVLGRDVRVGAGCELHSRVVVQDRCVLFNRVTLHPGVVIGADGFGYRPSPDGRGAVKIPHAGIVEIHDDVEIGANSAVDRAKFGATVVGTGTKIDNLVQIGHGCQIGRACIICGCSGLSGSVSLGDGVVIAGGVGIADNVHVGEGARVGAMSGVMHDVPAGETWVGTPAKLGRAALREVAALAELPGVLAGLKRVQR